MRRRWWRADCLSLTIVIVTSSWFAAPVLAQEVLSSQQARQDVSVREVSSDGAFVTGVIVNHTPRTVRDVRLEIRHAWLWKNERNPGSNNPGRTDYFTAPGDIAPGANASFTYKISPPLPVRSDGNFTTNVDVVAFSEVGQ